MEPPVRADSDSIRDEKVKILKAMPALTAENLVRGQFRGYRDEPGVKPAMTGDAILFARRDCVEEAWRIVDAALEVDIPVFEYEPQSWGPKEAERLTAPGGWQNPVA